MGQVKGKIHDVFRNRIKGLTKNAEEQAQAGIGTGLRPWQIPDPSDAKSLFDIENLHEPGYNRDELNTNYNETIQEGADDAGTLGDTIGLKLQCSYVAAEERAFRLRHASPVRNLLHAIGSREGHGNTKGIFGGVQKMAEDAIKAGGA